MSPVLIGGICVPLTVNCLQYLVTGSTLTAVGPFQLPAPQSGTLSRISSETRPSVQTVSDSCLKRICSLDTSAFSALEVLTTTALYKFTYLLTYFTVGLYNIQRVTLSQVAQSTYHTRICEGTRWSCLKLFQFLTSTSVNNSNDANFRRCKHICLMTLNKNKIVNI